ncbi:GNAT family N-acetyltransferase [Paenibacillus lautus]|uniref:GNAT family N-acetyltransferase n=1 Tax=Paenibacillus lautus TaxID=1401 RepID=UPI002DB5E335|nr:GNAT family N-acetyltransferase [Paenibacillus lautus]MEC0255861.1 GNAT family N-acetyltransferase [Paenibacillus lautus]
MNTSCRVSKLTKSDKLLFSSIMSLAFARDPLFLHAFGDPELDRKSRSRAAAFVSFMFDKSFLLNEDIWGFFENEILLGTFIVEKPGISKLKRFKGAFLLIGRLLPLLFQLPVKTLGFLNSYMEITRSAAPSSPHHYLIMIGVNPEVQGRGIGTAMLLHLLRVVHADNKSHGIALDTENKGNVNLYQRWGFALRHEENINDLTVYCMFYQR